MRKGIWNIAIKVCKGMESWNGTEYLEEPWIVWAEEQALYNELMRDKLVYRTEKQDYRSLARSLDQMESY